MVKTNIVYFKLSDQAGISAGEIAARLWSAGVRCWESQGQRVRMVTHRTITHDGRRPPRRRRRRTRLQVMPSLCHWVVK
ncbi:MAG: hypothetical protein ACRD0K_02460 [Egibacteraceae bacterium]